MRHITSGEHRNAHTRDELRSIVEEKLIEEGMFYIITPFDKEPTEDAYGFILDTLARSGVRITVEDE